MRRRLKLFRRPTLNKHKMSGIFIKCFVLICSVFLYNLTYTCADDTCKAFNINRSNLDKKLIGYEILEQVAHRLSDCAKHCFYYKSCKSINFNKNELNCKLNSADSTSVGDNEFEVVAGAVFSDISEWPSNMAGMCADRPCSEYQRCFDSKDGFQCIDITCDTVPTIDNGVLIPENPRTSATVVCDEGYETDKPIIHCQLSGKWEDDVSCVIKGDSDCKDVLDNNPTATNGIYEVKLWKSRESLTIFCDMVTDGGGWTIFQNRLDGLLEFFRNFSEYENGFGDLNGEFWLGLKYIQELAEQGATEIRLDVMRNNGDKAFEIYQDFELLGGKDYKLSIDTVSAVRSSVISPDRNFAFTNDQPFTAYDSVSEHNCATERHGAWWYAVCTYVNLNGWYCTPGTYCDDGIYGMSGHNHQGFGTADTESLKASRMSIRRV